MAATLRFPNSPRGCLKMSQLCRRQGTAPYILVILNGILRSLERGFQVYAKSVPEGAKFRNTQSACGENRNFEDFASLFLSWLIGIDT